MRFTGMVFGLQPLQIWLPMFDKIGRNRLFGHLARFPFVRSSRSDQSVPKWKRTSSQNWFWPDWRALPMDQNRSVLPLRPAKAREFGELWHENCTRSPWTFPLKLAKTSSFPIYH